MAENKASRRRPRAWHVLVGLLACTGAVTAAVLVAGSGTATPPYDFNGDGKPDLTVGLPGNTVNSHPRAGSVIIANGTSTGPASTSMRIDQESPQVPGAAEDDDSFGQAFASSDFNNDGYADLAIGQPLDLAGGDPNAGTIKIMFGSSSGLTAAGTVQIDQSTANVPGTPEPEDRFGEQVAIGDINGDGTADLVSATIGEQISGSSDRGSIHVLYGPITNAPASDGYIDSGNVTGIGEFAGSALALGHFNDDPYMDVAIGVSDQEVGDRGAAGRLAVFYANASGLSTDRVELFDQDTAGIAGSPESEDYFTSSLAAADFDGDGVDDLVIGMRSEAIGSATGSGASLVLFGNATGGITTKGALWIDQDTTGVPDTVAAADHFGWTVGALDTDGNGRVEPLIGAPGNAAGTVTVLKVNPGTLESAVALAEGDLGWPAGSDGDAFGIALPN